MAEARAVIGHPVVVAATVVLLVNDHLLKQVVGGPVTGKLSDVAGLIVAPAVVAAVAALLVGARARTAAPLACGVVAVVFAAVQLSPAAGEAWAWLLGWVQAGLFGGAAAPVAHVADPTDVWALPAAAVPAVVASRHARSDPRPADGGRRRTGNVMLLVAALACVATSPRPEPIDPRATVQGSVVVAAGELTASEDVEFVWEGRDDGARAVIGAPARLDVFTDDGGEVAGTAWRVRTTHAAAGEETCASTDCSPNSAERADQTIEVPADCDDGRCRLVVTVTVALPEPQDVPVHVPFLLPVSVTGGPFTDGEGWVSAEGVGRWLGPRDTTPVDPIVSLDPGDPGF